MPNRSRSDSNRSKRLAAWYALHIVLIGAGAGWTAMRYEHHLRQFESPRFRTAPLVLRPQHDVPEIIGDERLTRVLQKVKPRFRHRRPRINYVDHALRLWGVEARFDEPECLPGVEMRELLLDHRQFREAWGDDAEPFLVPDTRGVAIRTREGAATASHVDHTLASLAEAGTPLDYPVITPQGETRLRAVLEQSLADFSLNQIEYEWSTLAYALYLEPTRGWFSSEGQRITFDRLAQRIMRQRLAQGVCRGNHRLHTLVVLLRVDEQQPILSADVRRTIVAYLQDVTRRYVENQHADGYWDNGWPGEEWDGSPSDEDSVFGPVSDRLLVTGHVMEWWSLAPREVHPPREVLVRAADWLARTIDDLNESQIRSNYTFLTHAARGLTQWRGKTPAEHWQQSIPSAR